MSPAGYALLADLVVSCHLLYVLLVVGGQAAILAGGLLGWRFVRNFWLRIAHLAMLLVVVAQALLGVLCPLTTFESWLRRQAGAATYPGSFMGRLVHELLFVDAEEWQLTLAYCIFFVLVLLSLVVVRPAPPRRRAAGRRQAHEARSGESGAPALPLAAGIGHTPRSFPARELRAPGAPTMADSITRTAQGLNVPANPVIPFIEGDGTGPDIWAASVRVFDAAVEKAYRGDRRIQWLEVLAGEKAFQKTGNWLPDETLDLFRRHLVGIKGPLTTPVGGGIRSLNVALRQILDLYTCLRPVRYFAGVPSPVKRPELTDMVIFRENSEDIYCGIEFEQGTDECTRFDGLFAEAFPALHKKVRFPRTTGYGIKPVSREGTERLVRAAIRYAIDEGRDSVTLVHKGNIMKFTEGAFRDWGYLLAKQEFGATDLDGGPWQQITAGGRRIVVKDVIADAFLQQILTRPDEYSVIATMNLNGDFISDALAACVGGIGIAPGANINYESGHAIFEATHGTAPKYAGQDKVNPGSVILSGEMMLRYLGWREAADLVIQGISGAIAAKTVTYDFHRLMAGATLLKCSEFGDAIIAHMKPAT